MIMPWIVNFIFVLLIGFVIVWFWFGKSTPAVAAEKEPIEIKVAGGVYTPDRLQATLGQTLQLTFIREDETPCSETVIFADFNQSASLPVGKPKQVSITVDKVGEFEFTCQMGMYRGRIVVFSK